MAYKVLLTGDTVQFDEGIEQPTLTVTQFSGSSKASFNGKKTCVVGDESSADITCSYIVSNFTTPGTGTLKIDNVDALKAQKTTIDGKAVLLDKGTFQAKFEVTDPAKDPSSSTSDPQAAKGYTGTGSFKNTNDKWKAE